MSPPNEQWAFIQQLIDKIEILREMYERAKEILGSHGISTSDISSGMSISE